MIFDPAANCCAFKPGRPSCESQKKRNRPQKSPPHYPQQTGSDERRTMCEATNNGNNVRLFALYDKVVYINARRINFPKSCAIKSVPGSYLNFYYCIYLSPTPQTGVRWCVCRRERYTLPRNGILLSGGSTNCSPFEWLAPCMELKANLVAPERCCFTSNSSRFGSESRSIKPQLVYTCTLERLASS